MLRVTGKNIDLREITPADAAFVLSLRLDPELNQHLSPTAVDLQQQIAWIEAYKNRQNEWYFIIENKQQKPVGTIRLYDVVDNSFCWGSWIVLKEARRYASFESAILLYDYAFLTAGFSRSHFDVRKENKGVIKFHLRFGAEIINEDALNYYFNFTKENYLASRDKHLSYINSIGVK